MDVPLYTRSSDRSIAACPAQWHIAQQGIEEHTASWFEIGTALHSAIEDVIAGEYDLIMAKARAYDKVLDRIGAYKKIKPMLWSPNRPEEELQELSYRLMTNWYLDWMTGKRVITNLRWPPKQEVFILLSSEQTPSFLAGMKTQVDALFKCRRCKGTVMVDWKTGRGRRSDPLQLQVYRYGLEQSGYTMCTCSRGWGFFYHLEHRKVQEVEEYNRDEVEMMLFDSQLLKQERPIESIPSWKCDWCLGRTVCPAWAADDEERQVRQVTLDLNAERYVWQRDPL